MSVKVGLVRGRLAVRPPVGVHNAPVIDTCASIGGPVIRLQGANDGDDVIAVGKFRLGRDVVRHPQGSVLGLELQLYLGEPQGRARRDKVLNPQGGILALQLPEHVVDDDRTHRVRDKQAAVVLKYTACLWLVTSSSTEGSARVLPQVG